MLKIHAVPRQTQKLALPQSGKRIDEQLDLISITLNGLQKRNHVRIVHRLKLRLFRARTNDRIQGILPQIVQLLRLFQCSVQNAMNILRTSETDLFPPRAYTHLKQQAARSGLGMDPFIRNLVQGIRICEKPPEQYVDMLRELSAIGNNVNQIAHWANSKGYASQAEIHEAAVRVNEAYMMVRDAFR